MANWYYVVDGNKTGPVPGDVLTQAVNGGGLDASAMVWREGIPDWIPYSQCELVSSQGSLPPPIPITARKQIDDEYAWVLAFVPFIGLLIIWLTRSIIAEVVCVMIASGIVGYLDWKRLSKKVQDSINPLFSFLFTPGYLFYRSKSLSKSYLMLIIWIISVVLTAVVSPNNNQLLGAFSDTSGTVAELNKQVVSPRYEFNKTDKNALSNGNILIAVNKLAAPSPETTYTYEGKTITEEITKSPYTYIGRHVKIHGRVYKVEEMAQSELFPGRWTEVLLFAENSNSPLGTTSVDFMYKGSATEIKSGSEIIISGYYTGSFESKNAMGGAVEALFLVGDTYSD